MACRAVYIGVVFLIPLAAMLAAAKVALARVAGAGAALRPVIDAPHPLGSVA